MSSITLYNAQQAHQAIESVWQAIKPTLLAGRRLVLTVKEQPRSLPQNDHIQKLTRNIGAKIGRTDHDQLRMLLVEQWRHETGRKPVHVASFDGLRLVDTGNRSSGLDRSEAAELIEWLLATDASL